MFRPHMTVKISGVTNQRRGKNSVDDEPGNPEPREIRQFDQNYGGGGTARSHLNGRLAIQPVPNRRTEIPRVQPNGMRGMVGLSCLNSDSFALSMGGIDPFPVPHSKLNGVCDVRRVRVPCAKHSHCTCAYGMDGEVLAHWEAGEMPAMRPPTSICTARIYPCTSHSGLPGHPDAYMPPSSAVGWVGSV